MKIERILVTTDFSPLADMAFAPAAQMAADMDAKLIAVHVMESERPPQPNPNNKYFKAAQALFDADGERERECLRNLEERVKALPGVKDWKAIVGRGAPIKAILDIAAHAGANLIVISSAGRTGLKRMLLGSVAEELARNSPLPVLIWKQPS